MRQTLTHDVDHAVCLCGVVCYVLRRCAIFFGVIRIYKSLFIFLRRGFGGYAVVCGTAIVTLRVSEFQRV